MTIPIFLSSDNNYAPFVATTIASICDNTKSFIDFYILDSGISDENKTKIEQLKTKFNNFSIEYLSIKLDELIKEQEYKNSANHVSIATYNRFLITKLKPEIKRAIYLDVDIIVMKDIKNLWDCNLENKTIGLILDFGDNKVSLIKKYKQDFKLKNYYNAGVALINLKQWEEKDYFNKCIQFRQKYQDKINYADQDIINALLKNDIKKLPKKYNVQFEYNNDTTIRHYIAGYKPWKCNYYMHENIVKPLSYFDEFWHYAKMTEFYDELKNNYDKNINSNVLNKRLSIIADKIKREIDNENKSNI